MCPPTHIAVSVGQRPPSEVKDALHLQTQSSAQPLDVSSSAITYNMPFIPTFIWRSHPASFPGIPEIDTPPSVAKEVDAFLGFLEESDQKKTKKKKDAHYSLILEDNRQPRWTWKDHEEENTKCWWPRRQDALQLLKGWLACEANRTSFFPPRFLRTTFPQACSSSTPSEHHCQPLFFKVWTDDTLTCLPTLPLAPSIQKSWFGF